MLTQLRQQLAKFWGQQSKPQRIVFITLVVTALVLIPLFITWAGTPTYAVAFSGLSETDAGQIVQALDEQGITYQLRNSGTILVPSKQVYDVRLKMATAGLPEGGTVGFELFSGNTLGMTEFTQRVNYQRALEGELERTIGSLSTIAAVRVHVVTPEKTLLASEQAPTTASITLQEKPGQHVDQAQVSAITHLVASSVEGLKPENVVVVDVNGNLLASGDSTADGALNAQSDSHRAAELQVARELQTKVQNLLDSALGPNKSVVQVSVAMDWTQRETTTQGFDPAASAVRSEQTVSETYTTTNGTVAGIPGATTNLPPAGGGTTSGDQSVYYTRNEETRNFEITEVESHEIEAPGQVERVSLSVLVDGVTDANQLATLRSVISAAAGIDATRGDTLAVESLAFDRSYYETQAADMVQDEQTDLYIRIGEGVGAALILLALLWYVQRLLSNLRLASAEAWTPVLRPVSEMALASGPAPHRLTNGSDKFAQPGEKSATPQISEPEIKPLPKIELKSLPKMEVAPQSDEELQLQRAVEQLAEDDPAGLAEVIQLWLKEDEKRNG